MPLLSYLLIVSKFTKAMFFPFTFTKLTVTECALCARHFSNCYKLLLFLIIIPQGFPGGSEVKASAWNAGDLGSIPGLGRSPGEGNGNPLQYSCLENPMEGGAWQAIVHGVAKSRTRLSDFTYSLIIIPWRRQWHPTPVLLPGKSHGWRSLVDCSPWGR